MMDMNSPIPSAGRVITTIVMVTTIIALTCCMTCRIRAIKNWRTLPAPGWLIVAVYTMSMTFVLGSTILEKSFPLGASPQICDSATLLCLTCYLATKVLIYLFLVEKVFVIRNPWSPRSEDKLYLANVALVVVPYTCLFVLALFRRITEINAEGVCMIGIERPVLIPIITYEMGLNIYLTILFLAPLRKLHSFTNGPMNHQLRKIATRAFIGSCTTLTCTGANLSVLAGLDHEPGWLCLMLCNLDILFAALVLHWATSLDSEAPSDQKMPLPSGMTSQAPSAIPDFDSMVLNEIDDKYGSNSPGEVSDEARCPVPTQVQESMADVEKGVGLDTLPRRDSRT